jgi:hypothetical protein
VEPVLAGLALSLFVNFCLFPMKCRTSKMKLQLSDYKCKGFNLQIFLNVKQMFHVALGSSRNPL